MTFLLLPHFLFSNDYPEIESFFKNLSSLQNKRSFHELALTRTYPFKYEISSVDDDVTNAVILNDVNHYLTLAESNNTKTIDYAYSCNIRDANLNEGVYAVELVVSEEMATTTQIYKIISHQIITLRKVDQKLKMTSNRATVVKDESKARKG